MTCVAGLPKVSHAMTWQKLDGFAGGWRASAWGGGMNIRHGALTSA